MHLELAQRQVQRAVHLLVDRTDFSISTADLTERATALEPLRVVETVPERRLQLSAGEQVDQPRSSGLGYLHVICAGRLEQRRHLLQRLDARLE